MSTKEFFLYKDVAVPPRTTKEEQRVWSGWCEVGDREIVREAAVKGVHVNLAITFLSARKHISYEEAQTFFNDEVNLWVIELLNRKQIFRVSHILNNMKLDPVLEMTQVFVETPKKDLRDYIGEHLLKLNKIPEKLLSAWNLLKAIEENINSLNVEEYHVENLSEINKKDHNWRCKIGTELLFSTMNFQLKPYLKKEIMWEFLLKNNKQSLLKFWICLSYCKNHEINCDLEPLSNEDNFKEIFTNYPIDKEMIDLLCKDDFCVENDTKNFVLNELCKLGVFSSVELDNAICIIQRVSKTVGITKLYDLLKIDNQNVQFLHSLIKYCLKNKYYIPLNVILNEMDTKNVNKSFFNSPHLDLILGTKKLAEDFKNDKNLMENVFEFAKFLSNGDLGSYFKNNPLVFFFLVLLHDKNLMVVIKDKRSEFLDDFEINFDFLKEVVEKLPILKRLMEELSSDSPSSISMYDLLEKHAQLDVKEVFSFRFSNEPYPTFSSHNFKEAYKKKVNYLTYLHQERPSVAGMDLMRSLKTEKVPEEVINKVEKFAFKNYENPNLSASCVAFLRMIGQDCNNLRNHLQIANFLNTGRHIKGDLLFKIKPEEVINEIEDILTPEINSLLECFNIYNFFDLLKKYKIIVNFAKLHDAKFPEKLLVKLAENGLWLAFLIYVQFFDYPEEQVQKICLEFKDQTLGEHMFHALHNEIKVEDSKTNLMRERNSRNSFLSRIGVRKTIENITHLDQGYSSTSMMSQNSSAESSSSSSGVSECEAEMSLYGEKLDLLQVLVKCHNSTDPPKMLLQACYNFHYPLLAIFATSYEPDSVLTNWLTWLSVSCDLDTKYPGADGVIYNAKSVQNLIIDAFKNGYNLTVLESFQIFLPNNPLLSFLEVLAVISRDNFNDPLIPEELENFRNKMKLLKTYPVDVEIDRDLSYIENKQWIENVGLALIAATFDNILSSSYQQTRLLKLLIEFSVSEYIPIRWHFLEKTFEILRSISKHECKIRPKFCEILYDENTRKESIKCYINELIKEKLYKLAFEIGSIEGISLDDVILKKWEDEFAEKHNDEDFWRISLEEFANVGRKEEVLITLEKSCEIIAGEAEKYKVLKFALEWAKMYNLDNTVAIEKNLWMTFLSLKNYDFQFPFLFDSDLVLYSKVKDELDDGIQFSEKDLEMLTEADRSYLNWIIDSLLNSGRFGEALKISKMFAHKHDDLGVLVLCLSLAEGLVLPSQLNVEQRLLVNKAAHLRKFSQHGCGRPFVSLSNVRTGWFSPKSTVYLDNFESTCNDTLKILEILSERITNGRELAQKVFLAYRISSNIDRRYQQVLECNQPSELLKVCLKEDCRNKLQVIHDFITVWKWSKDKVADFVCEEVVTAVDTFTKAKIEGAVLWDLDLDRDFPLVLQFLPENTSSTLGAKLYSYGSTLYKAQDLAKCDFKIGQLQLIIELLIRAHDCFTADCNMEGISVILRRCKKIIAVLLEIKSWKLIVRLLTGVGRYTEMNYVFQILKENDHFEFLLRKGNHKDNSLKIALLEYLKKYCPENRELYRMVALHFVLYSEIAQLWEEEAQGLIKNLIAISKLEMQNDGLNTDNEMFVLFSNVDGTKISLNKAMQNFTHAAEYHLQGEKLMKAMQSAKQAELIALQLSMLKSVSANASCYCLLNLNTSQIATLINCHLRFRQSLILTEAYNYRPDWATAIYEQYVVQNRNGYLDSFLTSFPLTDTLVNDISRKFLAPNAVTATAVKNMKDILKRLPSIHTKYRIASELGFLDLIEEMLVENQLTYLKDTVWKKGYKN